MNMLWIGVIFALTMITVVGDSFLKKAGSGKQYVNMEHLLLGLCIYSLTGLIWFFIYKYVKFSISGAVYGVVTALVFTLVGVFYFKESLRTIEICGIGLAIISIILLSRFGE